jgi:hypothetical protein
MKRRLLPIRLIRTADRGNSSRLAKIFSDLLRNSFLGALLTGSGGCQAAGICVLRGWATWQSPLPVKRQLRELPNSFSWYPCYQRYPRLNFGCGGAALGNPRLLFSRTKTARAMVAGIRTRFSVVADQAGEEED